MLIIFFYSLFHKSLFFKRNIYYQAVVIIILVMKSSSFFHIFLFNVVFKVCFHISICEWRLSRKPFKDLWEGGCIISLGTFWINHNIPIITVIAKCVVLLSYFAFYSQIWMLLSQNQSNGIENWFHKDA